MSLLPATPTMNNERINRPPPIPQQTIDQDAASKNSSIQVTQSVLVEYHSNAYTHGTWWHQPSEDCVAFKSDSMVEWQLTGRWGYPLDIHSSGWIRAISVQQPRVSLLIHWRHLLLVGWVQARRWRNRASDTGSWAQLIRIHAIRRELTDLTGNRRNGTMKWPWNDDLVILMAAKKEKKKGGHKAGHKGGQKGRDWRWGF